MGKSGEASTHLGGPLGLVGLVLMSGAAGGLALVSVLGGDGNDVASPAQPVLAEIDNTGDGDIIVNPQTIPPSGPSPVLEPATSHTAVGTTGPPETDPVIAAPTPVISAPPAPDRPVVLEPSPQRPPISVRQIQTPLEKANFIVRFKDVPAVEHCLDTYKRDPVAGRAEFEAWAQDKPELSGVTLTGVTYSGEAILTYRGAADKVAPAARVGAIGRRIQSVEGVRYADPDYTAQPGKGD